LDLLSILLGQGQSIRLYRQLVYHNQVALNTYASSWGQTLAGQFSVYASLKPKQDPDRVAEMIENQVEALRETVVSQKELDKARNLFLKDYVDGLKRISGRARILASYETLLGDYTRIFSDLKEYQKVTPKDIRRVARLYLKPNQRNTVIVMPRKPGGQP
jgi:predicted Zn-dependent peptidase